MATLANFRTRIAEELDLDTTAAGAELAEIDARVNEGVVDFVLQTECKVSSTSVSLDADGDTALTSSVLLIKEAYVTSNGSTYRAEQVSPREILDRRHSGGVATSAPVRLYALAGADLLMTWPQVADTMTVYYVPRPAALSASGDSPSEIPAEFHPAVEAYALWKLASMDDDASSQQGDRYLRDYNEWIKRCRHALARKGGTVAPRFRVGRRLRAPSDPSADVWR